jgi:hypothetical protein
VTSRELEENEKPTSCIGIRSKYFHTNLVSVRGASYPLLAFLTPQKYFIENNDILCVFATPYKIQRIPICA